MLIEKKYTESELTMLLKQRDQSAFAYLYDNYSGALNSVILPIVKEEESACDILQEVFVRIWKQIDNYDETKGRLFTWMLNIARNASIDLLRSKNFKNSQQNLPLTETVYQQAGSSNTDTNKIGLRKLVQELKDDYRSLIDLHYFQGFTQEEISKIMDIPLGTVKTRLRSSLQQLRKIVNI